MAVPRQKPNRDVTYSRMEFNSSADYELQEHDSRSEDPVHVINPKSSSNLLLGLGNDGTGEGEPLLRSSSWKQAKLWYQRQYSGWRQGVLLSSVTSVVVLVMNIGWTAWAISNSHEPISKGIGTLAIGDCHVIKQSSLWLHVAINAVSTLLLGASNFTQQCLVAPTRSEVDVAHARRQWLDIGVPSLRNLHHISRKRLCLWLALALSSVPLHLLFNSAIFVQTSTYNYSVFPTTDDILQNSSESPWLTIRGLMEKEDWVRLDATTCVEKYGQWFISGCADVVPVFTPASTSTYLSPSLHTSFNVTPIVLADLENHFVRPPYMWMCIMEFDGARGSLTDCAPAARQHVYGDKSVGFDAKTGQWNIVTYTDNGAESADVVEVDHCLSRKEPENCKLSFSLAIIYTIIGLNAFKAVCMLATLYTQKIPTLVTLGDAISSFLTDPDLHTKGNCLLGQISKEKLQHEWTSDPSPRVFKSERHRWFRAVSKRRWIICIMLCLVVLAIAAGFLGVGIKHLYGFGNATGFTAAPTLKQLSDMGFGSVNWKSLLSVSPSGAFVQADLLQSILIANIPQLVLSLLYLAYNTLLTCMSLSQEFNKLSNFRKGLRVTSPRGAQRSSYYLSLPYTYAIPLMIVFGTLHWLASSSIFLVRLNVLEIGEDGKPFERIDQTITTCGYSCIAIIYTIILISLITLFCFGFGFRRLEPGIPLLTGSSAVIAAACHRPDGDGDAALEQVMWGVPKSMKDMGGNAYGHCCITSEEVEKPVEGEWYAGYK